MHDHNLDITSLPYKVLRMTTVWFSLFLVAVLAYAVYQNFFHPLAKYPGPFLSRFTELRSAICAYRGDGHLDIERCHQKYGPIVRYGPNIILFNTSNALRDIYLRDKNTYKDGHNDILQIGAKTLLTMSDRKDHARRSRIVYPALTSSAIRAFEPRLQDHIHIFNRSLYNEDSVDTEGWGAPILLSDWANYLTFDVIMDLVLGQSCNLLEDGQHRHILRDIEGMFKHSGFLMYAPYLALSPLDKWLYGSEIEGSRRYWRFVKKMISDAREAGSQGDSTMLARLLDAMDKGAITEPQIKSELALTFIAGSDTTSTTICAVLWYLAQNSSAYNTLAHIVRSTFPSFEDIRAGPTLAECHYIHACIKEALRISPAVSGCLYRAVGPEDSMIDGHHIPVGVTVGTGIYSIHHSETYYAEPNVFAPERWLDESGAMINPSTNSSEQEPYTPFSLGSRSCSGQHLASLEAALALVTTIWKYDFVLADGIGGGHESGRFGRTDSKEFQVYDHIVGQKRGPLLKFRPRV
ncbi:cytochrome P450 [Aspergillus stella-maris]|uniref:cytochrome P450 n=1 Tax=Aspergillus stella-maris TaxID=1810926 RepID=UPI003CCD3D24